MNTESAEAAKTAAQNAQMAAKAAAETATVLAVVGNDVAWMKKSLSGIEVKLDEMSKSYITLSQHTDVLKKLEDHETRVNSLEASNTRQTVLLSVGVSILTLLVSLLIYHIVGKG